jgi:hypothetical protein
MGTPCFKKTNNYKIYTTKLCIMLDFMVCAFCDKKII